MSIRSLTELTQIISKTTTPITPSTL